MTFQGQEHEDTSQKYVYSTACFVFSLRLNVTETRQLTHQGCSLMMSFHSDPDLKEENLFSVASLLRLRHTERRKIMRFFQSFYVCLHTVFIGSSLRGTEGRKLTFCRISMVTSKSHRRKCKENIRQER